MLITYCTDAGTVLEKMGVFLDIRGSFIPCVNHYEVYYSQPFSWLNLKNVFDDILILRSIKGSYMLKVLVTGLPHQTEIVFIWL